MHFMRSQLVLLLALSSLVCALVSPARAFIINTSATPWLTTASGTRTANGDPVTFTWSIVPDDTSVQDATFGNLGPSDLIASLDAEFGGDPNDTDLTQRPWFQHFNNAFVRWGALSGATYIYDPNDDGATAASSSPDGVLGVRGDLRIAGASIDGTGGSGNVLAFNNFPQDGGDMVLDTDDMGSFGNPANAFRFLRNTLLHEHGHGFGLQHVESPTDQLLMEPSINTSFDGPQLDEVRAIQFYFGDANEKSNGGLGNDTAALAADLGGIAVGGSTSVGSDADVPSQTITGTATDFVSIANLGDTDYYSFSASETSLLTATLTPRGGQFDQGGQFGIPPTAPFDASARSDLALAIFDPNGTTILDSADATGQGGVESLVDVILPAAGQYFARITGGDDTIQLYELELSITSSFSFLPADFDTDGDVDSVDLGIWETSYGINNGADANGDGISDGDDFLIWQQQFTGSLSLTAAATTVPEPAAVGLLLVG
ncbi:MAG: pre-peptidase C-terminal domain-containing protein, partial [Aeoliella sp.]